MTTRMYIVVALCALAGCAPEHAEPKRNIVIILTDDQRYDALSMLNPFFETPRLDELAQGGILFENAFVISSVCGASRATILTGQWSARHGVLRNSVKVEPSSRTFPQMLQAAGYETAFVGKWHLGSGDDDGD